MLREAGANIQERDGAVVSVSLGAQHTYRPFGEVFATTHPTTGEAELTALAALPSPLHLDLTSIAFKEKPDLVAALPHLSNVTSLNLNQTDIDEAGLAALKSIPNLRKLSLDHCPITAGGLAPSPDSPPSRA